MRSIGFNLYSSQHQEDLRRHAHGGGGGGGGGRSFVKFSYVTGM